MEKLIVVRHGDYGSDKRLNDKGKQQIQALAETLVRVIGGG